MFLVWTHGRPALDNFIHEAYSTHPSIKFTVEISTEKVPFLDVMVSLTHSGLKTSLYRKPTDRPTYLNHNSFHPPHIKKSIVFSQSIRFKRICSDEADYEEAVRHFVQSLLDCGYPYKLISREINRASRITRDSVLSQKRIDLEAQPERIPFVTRFNPSITPFLQKVKGDWKLLKTTLPYNHPSLAPCSNQETTALFTSAACPH